jgi:hypothetical protein
MEQRLVQHWSFADDQFRRSLESFIVGIVPKVLDFRKCAQVGCFVPASKTKEDLLELAGFGFVFSLCPQVHAAVAWRGRK